MLELSRQTYQYHFFKGGNINLTICSGRGCYAHGCNASMKAPTGNGAVQFPPQSCESRSTGIFCQFSNRAFGSSGPTWPNGIFEKSNSNHSLLEVPPQKVFLFNHNHRSYPNSTCFKFIPFGSRFWNILANTLRCTGGISKKDVGYMSPRDIEWLYVWVCLRNSLHRNSGTWMDWDVLSQCHRGINSTQEKLRSHGSISKHLCWV